MHLAISLFWRPSKNAFNKARNFKLKQKGDKKALSLKRVFKALGSLGLSQAESKVYVYLAKVGPSKAKDLRSELRMTKQQLYSALNSLKKKGIVTSKPERATIFAALAFEELLNLFMKLGAEQQKTIEEVKKELVNGWLALFRFRLR
jgi:DNA-binding MarR family transcriptional regulator